MKYIKYQSLKQHGTKIVKQLKHSNHIRFPHLPITLNNEYYIQK